MRRRQHQLERGEDEQATDHDYFSLWGSKGMLLESVDLSQVVKDSTIFAIKALSTFGE